MADQERKASLAFGVDSSGVKPGLDDIKSQVRDMATDVQQSGQRAAKGIAAIGDGAPAAAQKVDTSARSLIGSIQRTTAAMEAGEKGTAKYYETLAKQRGVSGDTLKPYLDDLRKAEAAQKLASGSLGSMEMSAKATAAAMRGVPAQFTDIITSLQGGQAPLTVFLQQGGQLKDMFGGAGNAARALGGYVLGLVNPFTIAAAAAGVLALAYNQGSKEADGYRKALILTGNAAGTTSAQLKSYAQDISGIVGTQGKAAESLTALAASGKVSADVLRDAGLAAVQYERATGQAVSKTAEQFASLRNEPLSGVLKLNEGMNFLTESTYRQIKSLDEQGRTAEAARVAQEAYASALTSRSGEIERNLGSIERGWIKIKDAAKSGWDAILNVGRQQTTGDQLADVRKQIADREALLSRAGWGSTGGGAATGGMNTSRNARAAAELEGLRAQEAALQGVAYASKAAAEQEAERAKNSKAYFEWDKQADAFRSKSDKRKEEVAKAEAEGRTLIAAGLIKEADLRERIAAINKKYEEKGSTAGQSEIAGIRAKIVAEQEYIDRLRERGVAADKFTEGERLTTKIQEELKGKLDAKTRTLKEQELVEAQRLATLNKVRVAEEQRVKAIAESEAAYRKFLDGINKGADAFEQQAMQQEAANASFGKSKTAIAEMNLAQAELAQSMAKDAGPWTPEYIAAMDKAVDAQRRWVRSLQEADLKAVNAQVDELLRNAKEMAALYEDESRLVGLSALERSKVVALRQVELKYAKQLAEIDKLPGRTPEEIAAREAARIKLLEAKQVESQAVVSRVVQEDWNKTSQLIGDTLADYIMNGGKDAAQYLKRLFATLVLQPVVQTVVGSVIGTGSGLGAATGAGGGAAGLIQGGQTIWSAISGGLTAGVGGAIASAGAAFGSSAATAFGSGIAAGGNLGLFGGGIGQGLSMLGSGAGGTAAGLGTIAGAALPWLAGGLALASVWGSLFGRKLKDQGIEGTFGGETDFEGRTYQYYKGGLFRSNKTRYGELDEDLRSGLADQFGALQAGTSEMAKILGLGTDAIDNFTASIKISFNGLDEAGIQNALKAEFEKIAESLSSQTLGTTEFTRNGETAVQTLGRLSGSLSAVNGVFENLSQTLYASSLAGADMASQLLDLFGGAGNFNSATASYFEGFYSSEEQRAAMERQLQAALDKLDLTLPDIDADDARAQFRALAEAQDLTTESGRKAWAALIQLSGAFAGITRSAEDVAAAAERAAREQAQAAERAAQEAARAAQEAARVAEASRSKEQDLQIQLLRAQGKELEAVALERKREMAALEEFGPAAQGIQREIWAIIDAAAALQAGVAALQVGADAYFAEVDRKAAEQGYVNDAQAAIDKMFGSVSAQAQAAAQAQASAAQAAAASWRSAASSIQSSLDKLRADTTAGMDPAARLALTRAQLGAYTAAALGGDADAAGKMAGAADAFLQASEAGSITRVDYLRDRITAEAQLASVLESSEAKASVQESIAAAANASVSELQALNANLTGFAGSLYELLSKGYQGADRGAAQTVAQSFAKMQADYDAYFNDLAGFGKVGNKYTDASFNGASFTKLDNNMAAFTGADGIVSYIRAGESLVEVAKRIPELRALWEKNYGIKLPAFAEGGYHAGGLRVVGERGWEIEATGPARIWNQQQIASAMRGGDNGSAQVVQALQTVSAQIARLEQRLAAIEDSNDQMATQQDNSTDGGNAQRAEIMNVKQLAQAIKEAMA